VKPTEQNTKSAPASKTGRFALLCALPRVKGSGAPRVMSVAVLALSLALALALLAPGVAGAAFSRPFEHQFTGTPTGKEGALVPFGFDRVMNGEKERDAEREGKEHTGKNEVIETGLGGPFGVAVDGENDLWVVGNRLEGEELLSPLRLDEFGPSGVYRGMLEPVRGSEHLTGAYEAMAINTSTNPLEAYAGAFYLVSEDGEVYILSKTGVFERSFRYSINFRQNTTIAVGNSTEPLLDPSAGDVYVYTGYYKTSLLKFNAAGEPENWEDFKGSENCECSVSNNEISFQFGGGGGQEGGVAVDPSDGDIWVGANSRLFELSPGGVLIREIAAGEANSLGIGIQGLAVDPTNQDLLVSLSNRNVEGEEGGGLVDEFNSEGAFLGQITEAEGQPLRGAYGVAVGSEGHAYVVNHVFPNNVNHALYTGATHAVDEFEAGHFVPGLRPAAATQRGQTSAVLNGFVDPESELNPERIGGEKVGVTDCRFEYVTEAAYLKSGFEDLSSGGEVPCENPDAAGIPKDDVDTPVHAEVSDHIESGVTYRYRLSATTGGLLGGSEHTLALAFTAPAKPQIVSTSTKNISSTFADLRAQIAPYGVNTSYFFEYGPTTAYGHDAPVLTEKAPDGEAIGAGGPTGGAVESVLQHVGPLLPGTTYHFRVVAVNECEAVEHPGRECVSEGEEETFTTLPAPVSSGRGYELVTPNEKQGGSDMFAEAVVNGHISNHADHGLPAEDGEGFQLETESGFGGFPFAAFDEYVFKREPQRGGWSFTSLVSPSLGVQADKQVPVSAADLSDVAVDDSVGSLAGEVGVSITSLVGPPGGPYVNLHEDARYHNLEEYEAALPTEFLGGSADLGHVVLASEQPGICPGVEDAAAKDAHNMVLCEWSGGYETLPDGEVKPALQLVNVAPGDEARPASECGAALGLEEGDGEAGGLAHDAVSQDGSRVFFTAPEPGTRHLGKGCWNGDPNEQGEGLPVNAPQLYARIEAGEGAHEVLEVSAPEAEVKEAGHAPLLYPAIYVGASADCSKVFFMTRTWMTKNHPEGHDSELYECEIVEEHCVLSRVSVPIHEQGEVEPGMLNPAAGAHVMFVPAVAAEGSSVYFTAFGVLAPGGTPYPVPSKEAHQSDAPVDLYRYDTETQRTSYVATVDTLDYSDEAECMEGISPETGVGSFNGNCDEPNWYTTPDGRYLLFGSSTPIDGYNAVAGGCAERGLPQTQALEDGRCLELYRYDAGAAERGEQAIVCVSCGSAEADAAGNAEFTRSALEGPALGPPRGMSNNGEYVFFDTQGALVPQATNHTLDTYQWRENMETHERSLSLVGSGSDPAPTFFLGYSPYEYETPAGRSVCARNPERSPEPGRRCEVVEGGNVFIGTHAKLSLVQSDNVGNVYDARVCEAQSPCIEPPAGETAQCEGGSCQTLPLLPLFQSPATNTLASSGNIVPEPSPTQAVTKKTTTSCKQGYVRKKVQKKEQCVKVKSRKKAKKSTHRKGSH
jgi:hypothetical protein